MNYFVLGEGGVRYGPATIETLTEWAREGRITGVSMVEDELGLTQPVSQIVTLAPYPGEVSQPSNAAFTDYPRTGSGPAKSDDVKKAWTFIVFGVVLFGPLFVPMAYYYANRAVKNGIQAGRTPRTVAAVLIGLMVIAIPIAIVSGAFSSN